jgi:phage terminase large subunit GpA-like protein
MTLIEHHAAAIGDPLLWPDDTTPSRWAEAHVVLPPGSAIEGPLQHLHAPYLRGMIDIANRPGVAQVNVMKAGQVGVSACLRWLMGFWAQVDPRPVGLTLPDKNKGKKIVEDHIKPFFEGTDCLRELLTDRKWDLSSEKIKLANGFKLYLMWAGSASSTSAEPLRCVLNDETDKMRAWGAGGGEGHAVYRTKTRIRTYEPDAIQINVSTPTTSHGMIARLCALSTHQLHYVVPCPHCGESIKLLWACIHWPKAAEGEERADHAARIRQERLARYRCQACDSEFDDAARRAAIQNGRWATIDEETGVADGVVGDAEQVPEWPEGTKLAFRGPSGLCATWSSCALSELAAIWFFNDTATTEIYTFITEVLGEPFEQQVARVRADDIREMARSALLAEGVCPRWTTNVIATVDTQRDHFWCIVRAWGPEMRSARVWHGRAESFDELDRLLGRMWSVEDGVTAPRPIDLLLIDSGGTKAGDAAVSRTMEVYAWALSHGSGRVKAIKGEDRVRASGGGGGSFYRQGRGWLHRGAGRKLEVPLWLLDVHHFQDQLAELMARGRVEDDERPIRWWLNRRDDEEYAAHLSNYHKVLEEDRGHLVEVWRPIASGRRVDYRHCEGYQVAAAYMALVHLLPPLEQIEAARAVAAARPARAAPPCAVHPDGRPLTMPMQRP